MTGRPRLTSVKFDTEPVPKPLGPWMTADEIAALIGRSRDRVYSDALLGLIPGATRTGRAWRFERAVIERWARGEQPEQETVTIPRSITLSAPHRVTIVHEPGGRVTISIEPAQTS